MSDVLLLSGGIDSIAIAAWRRPTLCLTIDYGQIPATAEISASSSVCAALELAHEVVTLPLRQLGSGALAGTAPSDVSLHPEFWPFRNQFLITVAAMVAVKRGMSCVLIGSVLSDSRHCDGREAFVTAQSELLRMQEGAIFLEAPALQLSSFELVKTSRVEPTVLAWAHSCHTANVACGNCPGCRQHSEIMQALGWNR